MSIPSGRSPQTADLPEYAFPVALSVMSLATAFALAPQPMTRLFLILLSQAHFFFSGQAA